MLGLKRGSVSLKEYSPKWPEYFAQEKVLIFQLLGDMALDIQHIGSTSVPDLCAKPIIDIGMCVPDAETLTASIPLLIQLGYEHLGDRSGTGVHFLAKGPDLSRTHYLHLQMINNPKWHNDLKFRDQLRSNEATRREYASLKQNLAALHADNREAYTQAKASFIQAILAS